MIFIINFKQLDMNIMNNEKYSFYLNEVTTGILPFVLRPSSQRRCSNSIRTLCQGEIWEYSST